MMEGLLKSIRWIASRRSSPYAFVITIVGLVAAGMVVLPVWHEHRCEDRIIELRATLDTLRRGIRFFHEQNGAHPDSLSGFRRALVSNSDGLFPLPIDLTGRPQATVPEHRELNDCGGYFYDPNTGEIRLNLTRPVKEYLHFYDGRFAEEIPSTW